MKDSILNGKWILIVDDEPDVLNLLHEEIIHSCPQCKIDKAATYSEATQMMLMFTYDLVILDIMGVRGFDLLAFAVEDRHYPVAMLTAHALNSEALKRSFEMKARAFLPKEKLGEIVPFLEDVMKHEYLPGWRLLLEKLKTFFDKVFEQDWEKKIDLK